MTWFSRLDAWSGFRYGVWRLDAAFDCRDIPDAHRRSSLCDFYDYLAKLSWIANLSRHQREIELVALRQEPGRINEIGPAYRIEEITNRHVRQQHLCRAGSNVKLWFLTSLHNYRRYAVQPIQARLQLVGCHFP